MIAKLRFLLVFPIFLLFFSSCQKEQIADLQPSAKSSLNGFAPDSCLALIPEDLIDTQHRLEVREAYDEILIRELILLEIGTPFYDATITYSDSAYNFKVSIIPLIQVETESVNAYTVIAHQYGYYQYQIFQKEEVLQYKNFYEEFWMNDSLGIQDVLDLYEGFEKVIFCASHSQQLESRCLPIDCPDLNNNRRTGLGWLKFFTGLGKTLRSIMDFFKTSTGGGFPTWMPGESPPVSLSSHTGHHMSVFLVKDLGLIPFGFLYGSINFGPNITSSGPPGPQSNTYNWSNFEMDYIGVCGLSIAGFWAIHQGNFNTPYTQVQTAYILGNQCNCTPAEGDLVYDPDAFAACALGIINSYTPSQEELCFFQAMDYAASLPCIDPYTLGSVIGDPPACSPESFQAHADAALEAHFGMEMAEVQNALQSAIDCEDRVNWFTNGDIEELCDSRVNSFLEDFLQEESVGLSPQSQNEIVALAMNAGLCGLSQNDFENQLLDLDMPQELYVSMLTTEIQNLIDQGLIEWPSGPEGFDDNFWKLLWELLKEDGLALLPGFDTYYDLQSAFSAFENGDYWESAGSFALALSTVVPVSKLKNGIKAIKLVKKGFQVWDKLKFFKGLGSEVNDLLTWLVGNMDKFRVKLAGNGKGIEFLCKSNPSGMNIRLMETSTKHPQRGPYMRAMNGGPIGANGEPVADNHVSIAAISAQALIAILENCL